VSRTAFWAASASWNIFFINIDVDDEFLSALLAVAMHLFHVITSRCFIINFGKKATKKSAFGIMEIDEKERENKMIIHRVGDLLTSDCTILAHQANCQKTFGAGIALQIKKQFPEAYQADLDYHYSEKERYGRCSVAYIKRENKFIVNLYAQRYPGKPFDDSDQKSRYKAMESSLDMLMKSIPNLREKGFPVRIGLPMYIGCGLAGGDWDVVHGILKKISEKYKEDIHLIEKP